jgi:cytochrome c-type biogenesis protein CcsB
MARVLPVLQPAVYPSQKKLGWESWYFSSGHMTWVWLVYLVSLIFLLAGVVYRWETARWVGLSVFLIAFGLHTFALGLRWYVSGRWPNSNMFEAVTTAVWFGALLAIVLELLAGRSALRNLFALTGAAASMVAMMAAHFLPELDPNISNRMPILHDIWLYIHTNVIIASYALIAMASVTGVLYLLWRLGGGGKEYARIGGAASLIEAGRSDANKMSKGEVFDGVTMILMELAVIMLWAGIIMGAIWADHSWGRPWGWDPKEVFAFNTFVIFLILVHLRLTSKDKGLWTAWLAVIGCAVMMFNWVIINFVISGLHSYA